MAKYGGPKYGFPVYGGSPILRLSVEPMSILVLTHTKVLVSWNPPTGNFTKVKLVRNQSGYPEDVQDGIVVYEEDTPIQLLSRLSIIDGSTDTAGATPFVSGKYVYYRMFLSYLDEWVKAGSISALVPNDYESQDKVFNILPRVFTSVEQTPLGQIDTRLLVTSSGNTTLVEGDIYDEATFDAANAALSIEQIEAVGVYVNALYNFLGGIGLTLDEYLTNIENLRPRQANVEPPLPLIPLETSHLGLVSETALPVKNQKRLVREALFMYAHKGTQLGLETYVESLTGFEPVITVSENLLLTPQDATFYNSIGSWTATNATLTASTDVLVDTTSVKVIDEEYSCKVVASASGAMSLGNANVRTQGIPVIGGEEYVLSLKLRRPTGSGNITPAFKVYDKDGTLLKTYTGSAVSADDTWKTASVTATLPSAYTVALTSAVGATGTITYTTEEEHEFVSGDVISVTNFLTDEVNLSYATIAATPTTTTFTISNAYTGTALPPLTGSPVARRLAGAFVSLQVSYSASGTYYIDQVCLQKGDTASYDEARAVDILLLPTLANLVTNPSFETSLDNWALTYTDGSSTITQDAEVTDLAYSGSSSAKIVFTDNWQLTSDAIEVEEGQYYIYSCYTSGDTQSYMKVNMYDSTDTLITTHLHEFSHSGSWMREVTDVLIPANSEVTYVTLEIGVSSEESGTIFLDCIQFEKSIKASDYFDGSLPDSYGVVWAGTAHDSVSNKYTGRVLKLGRLSETLNDWLPSNTWWRIQTLKGENGGVDQTNLTIL